MLAELIWLLDTGEGLHVSERLIEIGTPSVGPLIEALAATDYAVYCKIDDQGGYQGQCPLSLVC